MNQALLAVFIACCCAAPALGQIIDGGATVQIDATPWTPTSDIFVGHTTTGTLLVTNGGAITTSPTGYIGFNSLAVGTVSLSGAGSSWNTGALFVGSSGTGTMTLLQGASVATSVAAIGSQVGSTGAATVDGTGSMWTNVNLFAVGSKGDGRLEIRNGAQVVANALAMVGQSSTADGTVIVDGSGSTWNIATPKIGFAGKGTLQITSGGLVTNASGYVGELTGASGSVLVAGAGSTWQNSEAVYLGIESLADITVQNGGQVTSPFVQAAQNIGSNATAIIEGAGAAWLNTGSFYLGGNHIRAGGSASLTVRDGATLSIGDTLRIWDTGAVQFDGGLIIAKALLIDGAFAWSSGAIQLTGPAQNTDLGKNFTIIDGASSKRISANTSFGFAGTIDHISTQPIVLEASAKLRIDMAATYQFTDDGGLITASQSGATILNAGKLLKTGGEGESVISVPVVNTGSIKITSGTLRFDDGLKQTAGNITMAGGNLVTISDFDIEGGSLDGSGTITGNVNNISGTLRTGSLPGLLQVNGDYTQGPGAVMSVTLGDKMIDDPDFVPQQEDDPVPQIRVLENDRFTVTGQAILDGTLSITLSDGYLPQPDDAFEFLTFGTLDGQLTPLTAIGNGIKIFFDVQISLSSLKLVPSRFLLVSPQPFAPVPAPATLAIVIVGMLTIAWKRRAGR